MRDLFRVVVYIVLISVKTMVRTVTAQRYRGFSRDIYYYYYLASGALLLFSWMMKTLRQTKLPLVYLHRRFYSQTLSPTSRAAIFNGAFNSSDCGIQSSSLPRMTDATISRNDPLHFFFTLSPSFSPLHPRRALSFSRNYTLPARAK